MLFGEGGGVGVKQRGVRLCWTLNTRQKAWNGQIQGTLLSFHNWNEKQSSKVSFLVLPRRERVEVWVLACTWLPCPGGSDKVHHGAGHGAHPE